MTLTEHGRIVPYVGSYATPSGRDLQAICEIEGLDPPTPEDLAACEEACEADNSFWSTDYLSVARIRKAMSREQHPERIVLAPVDALPYVVPRWADRGVDGPALVMSRYDGATIVADLANGYCATYEPPVAWIKHTRRRVKEWFAWAR